MAGQSDRPFSKGLEVLIHRVGRMLRVRIAVGGYGKNYGTGFSGHIASLLVDVGDVEHGLSTFSVQYWVFV